MLPDATPATEEDWRTEYLDAIIAVGVVAGLDEAIPHIETYGSHHTDCIITEDARGGRALPARSRFRDRAAQRLDAIRRRRRVRLRRRDRHRHRAACTRAGPSASSSSARSNIACAATGRRGLKRPLRPACGRARRRICASAGPAPRPHASARSRTRRTSLLARGVDELGHLAPLRRDGGLAHAAVGAASAFHQAQASSLATCRLTVV